MDLPALATVELAATRFRDLEIERTGLADLSGFGDLEVECALGVRENAGLAVMMPAGTELAGPFASELVVEDNPRLPSCQVAALVAGLAEPQVACTDPDTGTVSREGRRVATGGNDEAAVCE